MTESDSRGADAGDRVGDLLRPAARLFAIAGSPPQARCEDLPTWCVVCAARSERTAPYASWQGASFTDQNKLRGLGLSERICEACVWAHSWVSPPGYVQDAASIERKRAAKRKAGKVVDEAREKGVNLRLFWHAYDERGYLCGNKGDKPTLRAWLLAPKVGPWWAVIPDSGQKHTLPWGTVNLDNNSAVVRFEDRDVDILEPSLVGVMARALTAGVTKDEIAASDYTARSYGIARAHVYELLDVAERLHGCGWWSLAVWLAQRDEEAAAARVAAEKAANAAKKAARGSKASGRRAEKGGGDRRRRGVDDRAPAGVPASEDEPAQTLGLAQGDDGARDDAGGRHGRGGHVVAPPPQPQGEAAAGEQLGLFGSAAEAPRRCRR